MTGMEVNFPLVTQQSTEELKDQLNSLMEQANEASLERFQAFLLFCLERPDTHESSSKILG